jgi:hypothetical protein
VVPSNHRVPEYLFSGARPSPGRSGVQSKRTVGKIQRVELSELAAPEDGRAPLNTYIIDVTPLNSVVVQFGGARLLTSRLARTLAHPAWKLYLYPKFVSFHFLGDNLKNGLLPPFQQFTQTIKAKLV